MDKIAGYMSPEGMALIQKAYIFSAAQHQGQVRRSGEPYLSHPLEVSDILAEMRLDEATICAGLLHDTVEDTETTIETIEDEFGEDVADIVDGVTKISLMNFDTREQAQAENIRKMILAMAEDIRVLIVKLCDRLHNMRTLEHMPGHRQQSIAQETLDIYSPLANRLGLHRLKSELEDLSLKYTRPDVYQGIQEGVDRHQTVSEEFVDEVVSLLEKTLKKNRIKGRVNGRTKHIFSIHHKMVQQGLTFEEVHDLIAFRVIVNSLKDCYAVLGLVHSMWKPVPGRFKDYISMPKANMYQSLHTTVIGPHGERIEIQIRTEEMHRMAEYGVASHWLYKEGGKLKAKDAKQLTWLREILDWQKSESDSREFIKSLKYDLFKDEVYVFTPKGQVKELPEGATPVDFAYTIHTEVGSHCSGAKINGKLSPLSTKLRNGDTVEILTDPHRRPSRDWLKFAKTAKARTRIAHYIRTEERERSIHLGKEMLEKAGRKLGVNIAKALKEHKLDPVAEDFSFKTVEDLLSAVGYARLTPRKVLNRLLPKPEPKPEDKEAAELAERQEARRQQQDQAAQAAQEAADAVIVDGMENPLVRYAKCCNPLPGDAITGYISRGRGMTIHTADCPNVRNVEAERIFPVQWANKGPKSFPSKIKIISRNVAGVLAQISALLAENSVNIESGNFSGNEDGKTEMLFTVTVKDREHLHAIVNHLNHLDNVIEVKRYAATGG